MDFGKDLDSALRYLGFLGRYNWIFLPHMFIFTNVFPAALTMMMVFITSDPESHYCTPPFGFDRNETTPTSNGNDTGTSDYVQSCHMYEVHGGILSQNLTSCQYGYEYSYSYGETTIVSEFDLVCDRRLLKETATTVFMVGLLIGAYPLGQLCDRFGRKVVAFLSITFIGASGAGLAFSYNYYLLIVMWFFVAVSRQGSMIAGCVLLIEMLPKEKRALGGMIINLGWGIGVVVLALLAFALRNWRHLQLLLSLGILVALPFWCLINESVRWLLSQKRYDDAENTLQKIAKFNRLTASKTFLRASESTVLVHPTSMRYTKGSMNDQGSNEDLSYPTSINYASDQGSNEDLGHRLDYSNKNEDSDEAEQQRVNLTVLDLFKTPNLAKNTLILMLVWVAASLTYYGLSLNATNLAGNMYLNFFLLGLVEIPAYVMAYLTMEHFGGRRLTTAISVLIAGITCVISAWIPQTTGNGTDLTVAIATFAMIGKFAIAYTWGGIIVYTPEVFPTGVRSAANGLLSSMSRVGAMVAPFILRLVCFITPFNYITVQGGNINTRRTED